MSDCTIDAIETPAVGLLVRLEAEGFTLRAIGDRLLVKPIVKLTAEDRAAIEQYRQGLLSLLLICSTSVQDRLTVFRGQLAKRSGCSFLLRTEPAYRLGLCYSCREPIGPIGGCRCVPCALAIQLAFRAPNDPASTAHHRTEAA